MADDPRNQQPPSSSINANSTDDRPVSLEAKVEDAETRAAREELRHTVISDKKDSAVEPTTKDQDGDDEMKLRSGTTYELEDAKVRKKTPDPEGLSRTDVAGERKVSSPKKKRAHDEVDQQKEGETEGSARTSSGADSDSWVMVDKAEKEEQHRSEPQKKRARDATSPPADLHKATAPVGYCQYYMEVCTALNTNLANASL